MNIESSSDGLAVCRTISLSPFVRKGERSYSSSSDVSPALNGSDGLDGLSPTPPTVTRAPSPALPSLKFPAELVIRWPFTVTVLDCPPGWKLNEIPRLSCAMKFGSALLTGVDRLKRVVWIAGPVRPPSRSAMERMGSVGLE